MKNKKEKIIIVIFILIASVLTISINWLYDNFGNLSIDEIIFHLKVPMEGTSTDMVWKYIFECPWKIIGLTVIGSMALLYPIEISPKRKTSKICVFVSVLILIICVGNALKTTNFISYMKNKLNDSLLIETEYVDPEKVKVEFLGEKRNLIYIFLESMETTFYLEEEGGLSKNDLIPEISRLSKESIDFSNTNEIGGAYSLYGTTWTAGAMVAQTTGVPLNIPIDGNALSEYSVFLEGAYSIGQILENNGYHNFLLLGSDAVFGGRKNLFEQHGNYEIWDFNSALEENKISEKIWWGYSDKKLFEFAKDKILKLSQEDKPFNFTMLTADTHFPNGYKCEECLEEWDQQYKNVISCSSKRVGEFIDWIKQQEFYDNTTIVIAGDHLTMQKDFLEPKEGQKYDKKVVNMFINPVTNIEETTRMYSTFDIYPTTLAAIGAKIEGNRLALGTNLFSDELTVIEKYGVEYVNQELMKASKFYDKNILLKEKN